MTRTPFDQASKALLEEALSHAGTAHVQHEVGADTQWVDVWFEPDPNRPPLPGLLGQMAREAALFEPFHEPPSVEEVRACLRKQLALGHTRGALPRLWVVSAGRPSNVLSSFAMARAEGWPDGMYEGPPALRLCVVVVAELPAIRDTLLVRLMGAGKTLVTALRDAKDIATEDWERRAAGVAVRVLRSRVWGPADEEIAMQVEESFRDWLKRERAEAHDEGAADILLRLLGQRFGELPADVVARIRSADRAELERLTDRVLTATTLEDAVR